MCILHIAASFCVGPVASSPFQLTPSAKRSPVVRRPTTQPPTTETPRSKRLRLRMLACDMQMYQVEAEEAKVSERLSRSKGKIATQRYQAISDYFGSQQIG
mgnify:CR=1 FL=1